MLPFMYSCAVTESIFSSVQTVRARSHVGASTMKPVLRTLFINWCIPIYADNSVIDKFVDALASVILCVLS